MTGPPNVVWITLDSVRYDHTSMSGYRRDTTPRLQQIADSDRGRSFSNAISAGIWTLASTASILTGTYPSHNQVGIAGERVSDSLATIPELLSERGFTTACLSGNSHLSEATGLDRGFEKFAWLSSSTLLGTAGLSTTLRYLLNIRKHSAGFSTDPARHSTPYLMNSVAKRWLNELTDGPDPFFFYLHYNEPHRPYYPPLSYIDRYTDDVEMSATEAGEFAMRVHYNLYEEVANGCAFTDVEWDALHAMYDAEIAYTDEQIGRLFDFVRKHCPENTVFVVTADHGELFGERGVLAHKLLLHDALVNVPLVVYGVDDLAVGPDDLVQHLDLMATLVAGAGGRTDQLQGIDLRRESREYAISQRKPADYEPFLRFNPDFDTSRYHDPMVTALRTTEFKYLKSEERTELFRLPDEETDVADAYPAVATRLDQELDGWLATDGEPVAPSEDAAFSDAMRKQLADLGYIEE